MTPFFHDDHLTVYQGDCREVMAAMAPESVHCVVTSPPYWGLRDYGTATWIGGDEGCDHRGAPRQSQSSTLAGNGHGNGKPLSPSLQAQTTPATSCQCGAVRQDSQLGLEPTPEAFVANMVAVFREVKRVLRKDGTLWLNLGDSYAAGPMTERERGGERSGGTLNGRYGNADNVAAAQRRSPVPSGLKPKDLVGIPWRVAFALQADGWYLRSDIIWAKPNPMPESVTDRPTKAHEYLFLLTKSARYYYDADAVREGVTGNAHAQGNGVGPKKAWTTDPGVKSNEQYGMAIRNATAADLPTARNLRSVWSIATAPYPGAHFATFPRKLVEPCVKAGTSERGVCPECGAPWVREVEQGELIGRTAGDGDGYVLPKAELGQAFYPKATESYKPNHRREVTTTGWRPSCAHDAEPVAATVLDPFAGSGTTGMVAQALGRRAVLIDLNGDYLVQAMARNAQTPLGLLA